MATEEKKAAVEETQAEIMVVHNGDNALNWEDLDFSHLGEEVTPNAVADGDLIAACENALGLKAGSLGTATIKRPSTKRIFISGRSVLG